MPQRRLFGVPRTAQQLRDPRSCALAPTRARSGDTRPNGERSVAHSYRRAAVITRHGHREAVVIAADDLDALEDTLDILSDPPPSAR
jgi:hypothetical protein